MFDFYMMYLNTEKRYESIDLTKEEANLLAEAKQKKLSMFFLKRLERSFSCSSIKEFGRKQKFTTSLSKYNVLCDYCDKYFPYDDFFSNHRDACKHDYYANKKYLEKEWLKNPKFKNNLGLNVDLETPQGITQLS